MENMVFSGDEFGFGGIQKDVFSCSIGASESLEGQRGQQQSSYYGVEDMSLAGGIGSFSFDYGLWQDYCGEQDILLANYQLQNQHEELNSARIDVTSPPTQTHLQEITKLGGIPGRNEGLESGKKEKDISTLLSLKLLSSYRSGFKRLNWERRIEPRCTNAPTCKKMADGKLSTEDVLRAAGEMFIRGSCLNLNHSVEVSFAGLLEEDSKDIELVQVLLAAAEELSHQQYGRAKILLNYCDRSCSQTGNPVQRLVYRFCEALREKTNQETRKITSNSSDKVFDVAKALAGPNPAMMACCVETPFGQVMQLPGIQAIVDNIAEAKKVHIIDFQIRTGAQWTALMEAFSSQERRLLELLKITLVGTTAKHMIEETGQRLMCSAQGFGLPFSLKIVMVSDMLELKEDLFDLDPDEKIAIFASYVFESMIITPNRLEHVMRVIKNIDPCIMVVIQTEGNRNSPTFVNRFIEALFFFGAYFDCFEDCMGRDGQPRLVAESMFLGEGIKSVVAKEGEERKIRHVKIDVWRAFFARHSLEEVELSSSSLYQAELILKKSPSWSSCTLGMNGRSLIAGWKGTPICSLSVWKFI